MEELHLELISLGTFQIIPITANRDILETPNIHWLYRVTLKNGDVWAVDPSGAQFGYKIGRAHV